MRLCHPDDCTLDRTAHGLVVRASCHAPRCLRVYGRLMNAQMALSDEISRVFLGQDDWAAFSAVQTLLDQMRCHADRFCQPCRKGRLLSCVGIPKHARQNA